ncbi:MAG: hypothetical protein R2729_10945 [Bryobacteraceae bacterium]
MASLAFGPVCPAAAQQKPKLQILVIDGEGAINNTRQRIAREPIVEVRDENDKPIGGAIVSFTLPNSGASGSFANGSRLLIVPTNDQGRAIASGIRMNNTPGDIQMRVSVSHQGETASTTINMRNVALAGAAGVGAATWVAIIAGAAAAAGIGLTLGLRGGDTPAVRPATTITPGPGTVGGR